MNLFNTIYSRLGALFQKRKLDAVRVAVLDAQAAEDIQQANSHACGDGGDGPGADVARDASTGGERTEKESNVCERLCECQHEVQLGCANVIGRGATGSSWRYLPC